MKKKNKKHQGKHQKKCRMVNKSNRDDEQKAQDQMAEEDKEKQKKLEVDKKIAYIIRHEQQIKKSKERRKRKKIQKRIVCKGNIKEIEQERCHDKKSEEQQKKNCLLYTSPSPRDQA
eukprot:TRINITY_DN6119_c0_g1_i1.p3 TRINITY_DN6119_c0_g1~~TRINITY_DN6119_c0_g1_i1.p3  ORF type:complete len:117 (-),score=32.32 TRINITY_DN6119_c0_g1_i1:55-405(-)